MKIEDLKKTVEDYVDGIEKRLSIIESNSKKLKNWSNLRNYVNQNIQQSDEAVLKQMTSYFGEGCLKSLIRDVAHKYIKDYEDTITAQSCDLTMIVKPKNP